MTRIISDVASILIGLVGMYLLLDASGLELNRSLLGIGLLLVVAIWRLGLIAEQQREQTELLALIAEGDPDD